MTAQTRLSFPERVVTPRTDGESRRLFVVRHCQSEANRDLRAEARGDSGLTETGIKQAQLRACRPHASARPANMTLHPPRLARSRRASTVRLRRGGRGLAAPALPATR
jgi:hypothetical protein